jgi:hypothetical protein
VQRELGRTFGFSTRLLTQKSTPDKHYLQHKETGKQIFSMWPDRQSSGYAHHYRHVIRDWKTDGAVSSFVL